jgi:hypothetical protein
LAGARYWRQWRSRSRSETSAFSTTAATGTSPSIVSGSPKDTASITAGWRSRTSSISVGAMFSPPRRIISFKRPTMVRYPAVSSTPESPVRNQPSRKPVALASGLDSYPSTTFGPRTTISPCSPGDRWTQAGSTTDTWTPVPVPTVPGRRSPGGSGLEVIWWDASVIPYACTTGIPYSSPSCASTDGARAELQERAKRSVPAAAGLPSARRSSIWCMVGTALNQVTRSCSTSGQKRRALNPAGATTVPPDPSVESSEATMPCTWKRGITHRETSSGPNR